ncbi:uncharacterized protein LOC120640232 [Panicum virgatum]|uniref:uncharacterized protein LOC120640232 n=1 Tax=Panicum virgatum TaxID=38727 RepID=UPI0019D54BFA|nr:uncharacterized protein LOC120640232 [Panicum virgatum]
MPGWRKAWLSVLDRAGGGGGGSSSGSLQAHLQGHHSPSSSSSSLASYKRGGKYGGGLVSGKAVVGCFSAALALAFFYVYVSVAGGPAADGSFPAPVASSSGTLLSWLSSNSSTAAPRKSLLPRPPVPPAVAAGGAAEQSDARNATGASRPVHQGSAVGDSPASEVGEGQATPVTGQTATDNAQGPPLGEDAGNATLGSGSEPAGNGTREEEPQAEATTPVLPWRRKDGAWPSTNAVVGAPGAERR